MKEEICWIGFDFDGVLVEHQKGNASNCLVGKSILSMCDRVREILREGRRVKIFTSRAATTGWPEEVRMKNLQVIEEWSRKEFGFALEITAIKDRYLDFFYDDRALAVEKNTGKLVGPEEIKPDDVDQFLWTIPRIAEMVDKKQIRKMILILRIVKKLKGRLFIIGNGGSAANASHAVNDFRKISGIQAISPCDNVAELTARINDISWPGCYSSWLRTSDINRNDCLLVLSVGGGSEGTSVNLVEAVKMANVVLAPVLGIVGGDGGFTHLNSDACVRIPNLNEDMHTAMVESWQAFIWHILANGCK